MIQHQHDEYQRGWSMLQKKVEQVDRSQVLQASNYFLSADSTTKESGKSNFKDKLKSDTKLYTYF